MAEVTGQSVGKLKFAIIPVTALQQNCTLWWDDANGKGALIDPGGDLHYIQSVVEKARMTPEKILLTHGHIDHAGGATELAEVYGAEIVGPHIDDKFLLEGLDRQTPNLGYAVRNVTGNSWLGDGEIVDVAGHEFEARHCPGHTPGSVVFINHKHRLMVVGDVLLRSTIGRTDFPYADRLTLIDSIETKIMPLGDDYAFICGHGPGSTVAVERDTNPKLNA